MSQKDIKVDHLTKVYGERFAVNCVSFEIPHGTIHGILGPNGAGKTTTMRMLAGLIRPTSGSISIMGLGLDQQDQYKKWIGLLPEEPPLYLDMTVRSFLLWVAKLHDLKNDEAQNQLSKMLLNLDLKNVENRLIGNLSKGYKQRVAMASTLIFDPKIIILDEPTVGLDPNLVIDLRAFIKSLKQSKTVLFSSHILSEVEAICDGVTILHQGQMKAHGSIQEVKSRMSGRKNILIEIINSSESILKSFKSHLPIKLIDIKVDEERLTGQFDVLEDSDLRSLFLRELLDAGFEVVKFEQHQPVLEDVFHELTQAPLKVRQ